MGVRGEGKEGDGKEGGRDAHIWKLALTSAGMTKTPHTLFTVEQS